MPYSAVFVIVLILVEEKKLESHGLTYFKTLNMLFEVFKPWFYSIDQYFHS